jgi:hypothetical protein
MGHQLVNPRSPFA